MSRLTETTNNQGHKQVPYLQDRWHRPLQRQNRCTDWMSLRGKHGNLCHHTSHPWHRPQQVEWPRWHRWSRCSHSHRLSRWQPHPWSRILLGTVSCWMLNTKQDGYKCLHPFSVRDRKVKNVFTHFLFNSLSLDHRTVDIILRSKVGTIPTHPAAVDTFLSTIIIWCVIHSFCERVLFVHVCILFVYVCVCAHVHVHMCMCVHVLCMCVYAMNYKIFLICAFLYYMLQQFFEF